MALFDSRYSYVGINLFLVQVCPGLCTKGRGKATVHKGARSSLPIYSDDLVVSKIQGLDVSQSSKGKSWQSLDRVVLY